MRQLKPFFADKPVRTTFVSDIMKLQWMKFARNISMNLPQAILGVGIGAYEDTRYLLTYSRKLEDEVRTVAAAYGYPMEPLKKAAYGLPQGKPLFDASGSGCRASYRNWKCSVAF